MRNQSQDETFDKYVTDLKILASTCNYGALHDSLIRDRLICGINDSNLREKLLRVADLDLQKCLEICRAAELSKERIETPSASGLEVHALHDALPICIQYTAFNRVYTCKCHCVYFKVILFSSSDSSDRACILC
jgi:hypothetical protein